MDLLQAEWSYKWCKTHEQNNLELFTIRLTCVFRVVEEPQSSWTVVAEAWSFSALMIIHKKKTSFV